MGSAALLAGSIGIWLFYVQHQFEDAYWQSSEEWSYADAALRGSSYLKLPTVLRFFTGTSGCTTCTISTRASPTTTSRVRMRQVRCSRGVPTLSLWDGLRSAGSSCGTSKPAGW